jgi:hypothetical protein
VITQPKTILDTLVIQLSEAAKTQKKPNDFEIRKFKKEAEKLKNVSLAQSAMAKGMIAFLEGNLEECKRQHELSLMLNNDVDDYDVSLRNYAVSMHKFGQSSEAYRLLKLIVDKQSTDLMDICLTIEAAFYAGYLSEVLKYYDLLLEKSKSSDLFHDVQKCICEAKEMIDMKIPEDVTRSFSSLIEEICSSNSVLLIDKSTHKMDGEIFQWVETTADVDTTVEMNFILAEKLSEMEGLVTSGFNVVFRAHQ